MPYFTINFSDLNDEKQLEIQDSLKEIAKEELQDECEGYMSSRADQFTKSGVKYSEANWEDIAMTEYDWNSDIDFENFYQERADHMINSGFNCDAHV